MKARYDYILSVVVGGLLFIKVPPLTTHRLEMFTCVSSPVQALIHQSNVTLFANLMSLEDDPTSILNGPVSPVQFFVCGFQNKKASVPSWTVTSLVSPGSKCTRTNPFNFFFGCGTSFCGNSTYLSLIH